MSNSFVPYGGLNLAMDESFQARRTALKQAIHAKYAAPMARAGIFGKLFILYRIHREFCRKWKRVAPSFHSLF